MIRNTLLLLLYAGLLLLLFFGMPDAILYSLGPERWLPVVLIFLLLPYVLHLVLRSFRVGRMQFIWLPASFLSTLILFGKMTGKREDAAFREIGVRTPGVVYTKQPSTAKGNYWVLRCQYTVNGRVYSTFTQTDRHHAYEVGDTLTVVYIPSFPQKCRILELQ